MTQKAAQIICGNIKQMFSGMGIIVKPKPNKKAWRLTKKAIYELRQRMMSAEPEPSQRELAAAIGVGQTTINRLFSHKIRGWRALDYLRRICVSDRHYEMVVPIVEEAQRMLDDE